jgi:hypothetical protein
MAHMNYGVGADACADGVCGGSPRIVTYVVTGAEANAGVDFFVPITDSAGDPVTLSADTYEVGLFGIAGAASVPVPDFPNAVAGDRTTTQFRVLLAAALTVGDTVKFQIVEV